MTVIIPYTCQDSKRKFEFCLKKTGFCNSGAIFLVGKTYFEQSRSALDKGCEISAGNVVLRRKKIDAGMEVGVYCKSGNSIFRTCEKSGQCPKNGGKANGMKYKKSSNQKGMGASRGAGRAVAAMVMALAIAVGGGSTTALLLSQPTGLTVVPSTQLWEKETLAHFTSERADKENPAKSESAAASSAVTEEPAASEPTMSETAAESKAESTVSQPEETVTEVPAASETETPAVDETPSDDATAESPAEIEEENNFPYLQPETAALAAEDPLSAPTEQDENTAEEPVEEDAAATAADSETAENTDSETVTEDTNSIGDGLEDIEITTENGTIWMTPEEIKEALDEGTLDEEELETACLDSENGILKWLWKWFFGVEDDDSSSDSSSSTPSAPSTPSTPEVKPAEPVYTGWSTVNGKTYYYDQGTHKPVTGIRAIDSKLYYFDANGVQQNANFGIDVSKYQSNINWNQVKKAGVNFAIIRIGYRGYGSGTLVQDPMFEQHFTNARNAGLKVGVYFFSQAVNENEAREEAQACWRVLNGRGLEYPIYFDSEASGASNGGGRADGLGQADRTKCAIAFCEEVKALGYQPGVYASTQWFRKRLDLSQLTKYSIWNAHYNVSSSPIACNMWQGSCSARISGYSGQLDVNISYMG